MSKENGVDSEAVNLTQNLAHRINGEISDDELDTPQTILQTPKLGVKKSKSPDPATTMMTMNGMTPQAMQQLIQQQVLSPQGIQQMMQQQTLLMSQQGMQHKLQEQVLQQLNEQLQLNVLQQSQLMQQANSDKTKNKQIQMQLQQLGIQQQQLVQQIQLQQRQYLMSQGLGMQPMVAQGMSPAEMAALWKEVSGQSGADENKSPISSSMGMTMSPSLASIAPSGILMGQNPLANGLHAGYMGLEGGLLGPMAQSMKDAENNHTHPLYGHGVCKWPGCDVPADDFPAFMKHLNNEHTLDDRSTAQARVQMQVVSQLEIQLAKERERLQAMMAHLHMNQQAQQQQKQQELQQQQAKEAAVTATVLPPKPSPPQHIPLPTTPISTPTTSHSTPTPQRHTSPLQERMAPQGGGPIRRRVSDKCNMPMSTGAEQEIHRNREFYKNTDVRPPFTYASLIRQAINESGDRQLTLSEIYNWFEKSFAFFRKNQATWKNAVRHNLSLHKCFMRVENVKGAVWTVDEIEFYKRRPQKMSGSGGGMSTKRESSSPGLYGETLNASLRAALAESNLPLLSNNASHPGAHMSEENAEDLSMRGEDLSLAGMRAIAAEAIRERDQLQREMKEREEYSIKQEAEAMNMSTENRHQSIDEVPSPTLSRSPPDITQDGPIYNSGDLETATEFQNGDIAEHSVSLSHSMSDKDFRDYPDNEIHSSPSYPSNNNENEVPEDLSKSSSPIMATSTSQECVSEQMDMSIKTEN
ncbi:unnamed protein product [Owenia fusiformis]|uniref:Uncharacterized protein n=1 Tax=Owenia fusiformis TaxID=6347 RepID=A0A8J1XFU7_OWEFU|nr:unnamed protein product [Owenia fusiformis]